MVYLIHFDKPYRHARHYTGYARARDARRSHAGSSTTARVASRPADTGRDGSGHRLGGREDMGRRGPPERAAAQAVRWCVPRSPGCRETHAA